MHCTEELGNIRNAQFLKKTDKSSFFLGNTSKGKEIWLTNEMLRRHMLVSGTTGAGKTEFLLSLMLNSLANGGGGIFVDGKGDLTVYKRILAMAERFDRRDDVYVLNFMNRSHGIGPQSNTINPFALMSADAITNLLVSLMEDAGGDGAMWRGRAISMFTGVIRALTWLRDNEGEDLTVEDIRDHINLKKIINLCDPALYPALPMVVRRSLKSYLNSLPGYQPEKGYKQSQTTLDQHGYLEMQWTRCLGMMADVYGDIFNASNVDIDISDIMNNRRILVVLLPALEKAQDEIANLGKFIVSLVKTMAGEALGTEITGSWHDVIDETPIRKKTPFTCIFDEASFYLMPGLDVLAAQARSLNINLVFSTQEIGMMLRRDNNTAQTIISNCVTKVMFQTMEPAVNSELAFLDLFNNRGLGRDASFFEKLKELFSSVFDSRIPIQDRLRNLTPGQFLFVHGDAAVFASGTTSRIAFQAPPALNQFHDYKRASREICLRVLAEAKRNKPVNLSVSALPSAFASLIDLDSQIPAPGGHVHLSAALKTLAGLYDGSAAVSPTHNDELLQIGN